MKDAFRAYKLNVVADRSLEGKILELGMGFVDENEVCPGLNKKKIGEYLQGRIKDGSRAGWYFQQFLKMSICMVISEPYYLIWDGDTIPLKDYLAEEESPVFDVKTEYNEAYFDTMGRLFPYLRKTFPYSFISEHMLVKTSIMKGLIGDIEKNELVAGTLFFEKILNAIDTDSLGKSGFSEYETYGAYAMFYYPGLYTVRPWASYRGDNDWLPCFRLDDHFRKWLSRHYDAVSFDNWQTYNKKKYYLFLFFSHCGLSIKASDLLCKLIVRLRLFMSRNNSLNPFVIRTAELHLGGKNSIQQ